MKVLERTFIPKKWTGPKNQIACGHPARFPGYSEIIGSIAQVTIISAIETLLSVIFGKEHNKTCEGSLHPQPERSGYS